MRNRGWIAIALAAFVVLVGVGMVESVSGNAGVAQTLNAVGVLMFFLLVGAVVVALVRRRRDKAGASGLVTVLCVLVVALALGGAYSYYRGHTAAERFANEAKELDLPAEFVAEPGASVEPDVYQTEFVARVWRVEGPAADACEAAASTYRKWADGPIRDYRDDRCALESTEGSERSRIELEGNVLTLQMWMPKSEGF